MSNTDIQSMIPRGQVRIPWTIVVRTAESGEAYLPYRADGNARIQGVFPEVRGTWREMDEFARTEKLADKFVSVWLVPQTATFIVEEWETVTVTSELGSGTMNIPLKLAPIMSADRNYDHI